MLYSPRIFFKDKWNLLPFLGVLLSQIFILVYNLLNIKPTTEQIFLHYNVVFGVDLIGEWWKIYYLPLAGLVVLIFNYLLAMYFYGEEKLLARLLSFFTLFFHVFLTIAVILIVGKNT